MGESKATIKQGDPVSKLDVTIVPRSLDHTSWALKELNPQNHSSLSLRIHGWLVRSLKRGKGQMQQQFLKQLSLESPQSENLLLTAEKSLSVEIQDRVSVDESAEQSRCASSVCGGLGWVQCRWQRMDGSQPNLPTDTSIHQLGFSRQTGSARIGCLGKSKWPNEESFRR